MDNLENTAPERTMKQLPECFLAPPCTSQMRLRWHIYGIVHFLLVVFRSAARGRQGRDGVAVFLPPPCSLYPRILDRRSDAGGIHLPTPGKKTAPIPDYTLFLKWVMRFGSGPDVQKWLPELENHGPRWFAYACLPHFTALERVSRYQVEPLV